MEISKKLRDYIELSSWVFAKTYAYFAPHWYVVVKLDDEFHNLMLQKIQKEGVRERKFNKDWRYWINGEYRYWIDEAYKEGEFIINRTFIDEEKIKSFIKT